MGGFSEKIYLQLKMPRSEVAVSDHRRLQEAKELAENMYCVQFASVPDFLVRMQAAKFIPHTDMSRFPSVKV